MQEPPTPYMQMILRCEEAIARIRAVRSNDLINEQTGHDIQMIRDSVQGVFARKARRVAHLAPGAMQEAMERMNDRLYLDIFSPGYASMTTGFASYLVTMPWRVIDTIKQKYSAADVSLTVERLDATDDMGIAAHERIADTSAEDAFFAADMLASVEAALPALTPAERFIWRRRYEGYANGEAARELGVSDSKATTLYKSACRKLKAHIEGPEEGSRGRS